MSHLPPILIALLTTFTLGAGFGVRIWNSAPASSPPNSAASIPEGGNLSQFLGPSQERVELFYRLVSLEPTVRQVQKETLRYGNLKNGKIVRWHAGSRLRALVPRLTLGRGLSLSNNIDIDRGATSTPDQFIVGPETAKRDWDFGLTWELGDLVWSTAQSTIDSRMRTLGEARRSLLREVTQLYFERRRIQTEIGLSFPFKTFSEQMALLLRLDELTAQVDALTNGYFSEEVQKIFTLHPELDSLYSVLNPDESGTA